MKMTLKNIKYQTKIVLQIKEKKLVFKKYLKSDKEEAWLMCCSEGSIILEPQQQKNDPL